MLQSSPPVWRRRMRMAPFLAGSALLPLLTLPAHADDTLSATAGIAVDVLAKSTRSWNGSELPPYGEGQAELSVVRVTIPPGQALPLHEHPHATAGLLLQGTLEVHTPGGERTTLHAGEGLIELVNQPHAGANTGEVDAVIIVVYAGIEGEPVTVLVEPAPAELEDAPL